MLLRESTITLSGYAHHRMFVPTSVQMFHCPAALLYMINRSRRYRSGKGKGSGALAVAPIFCRNEVLYRGFFDQSGLCCNQYNFLLIHKKTRRQNGGHLQNTLKHQVLSFDQKASPCATTLSLASHLNSYKLA